LKQVTALTVREAIKSGSPAIGFICQDSRNHARAILSLLVIDLVKSFNVGKTMNDQQVAQTVELILDDEQLRSFKPDDFKLCFNKMKKGVYGKNFDRIDTQTIFEGLYQYLEERLAECEQISQDRHKELLKAEKGEINPEGVKKVVEILKSALKEVKEEKPVKEVKDRTVIQKTERDLFIQNCFTDFFKEWKLNPYKAPLPKSSPGILVNNDTGGKFILYGEKVVDEMEYVLERLKEYDQVSDNKSIKELGE
jgi:hypothetical protein